MTRVLTHQLVYYLKILKGTNDETLRSEFVLLYESSHDKIISNPNRFFRPRLLPIVLHSHINKWLAHLFKLKPLTELVCKHQTNMFPLLYKNRISRKTSIFVMYHIPYTYTHTYTHIHTHTYISIHKHAHAYTYTHTHTHTYTVWT